MYDKFAATEHLSIAFRTQKNIKTNEQNCILEEHMSPALVTMGFSFGSFQKLKKNPHINTMDK